MIYHKVNYTYLTNTNTMRELNEYPSNELGVLIEILRDAKPKLPTERTFRLIWMNRLLDAHKDAKESEKELNF